MATASRPLGGSAGDVFDYLNGDRDDACSVSVDYYGGTGDAWGSGAARLGVTSLAREQFVNLAEGRSLDGSSSLIQTQNGKHVAGIDVVMSAPKSASVLFATATEEERRTLHREWAESVRVGFERMERDALVCRVTVRKPSEDGDRRTRQQGSTTERVPAEMVAFIAHHHTARPTEETEARGAPPDPHLHTHAFVFNQAFVPDEDHPEGGKWRAVDDYGIKKQAEAREALVQAEFGRRLEGLGYRLAWSEDRKGYDRWEVDGFAPALLRHYSSNARRAERVARDFERKYFRPPTDAELRDRMRTTRRAKDQGHEHQPAWADVIASAEACGLSVPVVAPGAPIPRPKLKHREQELRSRIEGPNGLCREDAVFDRDSISTVLARCALGLGFTLDELDDFQARYVATSLVLTRQGLSNERFDLFTTNANLTAERLIADTLDAKANDTLAAPTPDAIERAVARLASEGLRLDGEQVALVEAACSSTGLTIIEGFAGTGKTTALKAVVHAYRDHRSTGRATTDAVIALCVAGLTAQATGSKLDADVSCSVDAFIRRVAMGKIKPTARTVIVVDEAVLLDTYRMARLLAAAGPARLILLGDPKQLQAIGAAGWHADMVARHGRVMLTKVHRQESLDDVRAFASLRNGNAEDTLGSLHSRGRLHIAETRAERLGEAVAAYIAERDAGRDVSDVRLVVDGSNEEVDQANRILQQDRLRRGELVGDGVEVRSTTTDRAWTLYEGDEVLFLANHFDGRRVTNNGSSGRITSLADGRATIALDLGGSVTVTLAELAEEQRVGLRYCLHAAKMQGQETKVVLALPGRHTTSLEAGYSALTRCIEAAHVFLDHETHGPDPVDALIQAWSAPAPKVSATARVEHATAVDFDVEPPADLVPRFRHRLEAVVGLDDTPIQPPTPNHLTRRATPEPLSRTMTLR